MAYQLKDLLKGLDDATVKQVEDTIKTNSKDLDAKVFIDGDGEHFVPHARFDEVVRQRDSANSSVTEQKEQLEKLAKQVEDNSDAQATIQTLTQKLEAQSALAKNAILESRLTPLIQNSIAPASDILGFMDLSKITVNDDGKVEGLEDQLKVVQESKKYLFKDVEPQPEPEGSPEPGKAGTGNPGNSGRLGSSPTPPKEVGAFGKQLAAAVGKVQADQTETTSFFK